MKRTLLALMALSMAALPSLKAQSDQDIGTLLPENTSVLVMMRSLSKFYELPEDHALVKMVEHPAMQHIFGEAIDEMSEEFPEDAMEQMGVTEEQMAQWFPGRLLMAGNLDLSMLLDAAAEGATGGGEFNAGITMKGLSFLGAADTTITEEELTELIAALAKNAVDPENADVEDAVEDARSFKDEFEGFPMVRLETMNTNDAGEEIWQSVGFILANEMLVIAPITEDRAQMADSIATDMVQRIKSGGAEPNALAGNRSYIDSVDQLEDADLFLFAPLEDLAVAGETAISNMFDEAANQEGGAGPGINMFLTKDGLLTFLGLKDFKRMTIAAKIQPDGIEFVQELATNERSGIISKLMNYEQGIQLPEMDPAGMTGITVSGYKVADSLEMVLTELPKLSPMLGMMMTGQLAQMENQGLKIRNGMLPAMGDGLVAIQGYANPNPAEDQLPSAAVFMNATDPAGLSAAMSEIVGYIENNSPFGSGEVSEPREFMGEQIFDVDSLAQILGPMLSIGQANSAAYAIVGDQMIMTVGEEGMMDHVIASMKKGSSSLEDHETLAESWKMWGNENLIEFGYSDLATQLKIAIYGSEEGLEVNAQVGESTDAEEAVADALEDMPSFEGFNYSITEKSYDTADGWVTRVYIAEKPGQ